VKANSKQDAEVKKYLTYAESEEQFDLGYRFKHVDTIFRRVFGESWGASARRLFIFCLPVSRSAGP
jgi:hypothetical protein